jgi:hypothetical protein
VIVSMSGSPDCAAPAAFHEELLSSGTETASVPRAASLNATQHAVNSEFALFSVSSPRRLGESLRSAASSHFPSAIDRIVKESSQQRSQSKRAASHNLDSDADHISEIASEDHAMSDCGTVQGSTSMFLRNADAPESSDSFARTSSFASNQNSSMTAAGAAPAAAVAVPTRKKSFFASLLESSPTPAPPPAAQQAPTGAKIADTPRKSYRCKVSLIGESGSGKTTFQRCVTQSVLRTLPDVTPSISSSSSLYYYRSTTRREKLDMLLVDAGPDPLSTLCGLGCVMEQTNCFGLVMSLAGVKQRTSKKFLSFGNEPSAIVHARDKAMIRSHLSAICATMDDTVTSFRPPKIVVIGTHRDFLTDQSREAVETVLREVNRVVADVLREFRVAPMLIGCFAVSCLDHTCVPENRGGPRGINELWNFLCEVNLKDASQGKTRALVGEPPIRWEELSERMAFEAPVGADGGDLNNDHHAFPKQSAMWLFTRSAPRGESEIAQPSSLAMAKATAAGDGHLPQVTPATAQQPHARQQVPHCSTPIPLTVRNADLSIVTDRVVTFIRRAKTELNFVVVHTRALRQVAFSLGVFSKDHLDAILRMLSRDGEILLLDHQPHHVGGREDSVVLWPHLAHRAVAALSRYHSSFGHWTSSPAAASAVPGVDPDECRKADVDRRALTHGVFSPGLVVALSRSLPQTRRPIVERAETFALLLLLSDFVFQRRCRKRNTNHQAAPNHHHRAGTPQEQRIHDAAPTTPPPPTSLVEDRDGFVANVVAAVRSPPSVMVSKNASMAVMPPNPLADDASAADHVSVVTTATNPPIPSWGVEYVAPSLTLHKLPSNVAPFFLNSMQRASDHGELLLGAFAAKTVRRTLRIPNCPPHVVHRMMCRWSPYIVPTSLVFSDAIFLRRVVSSLHCSDDATIPGAQRSGHDESFMLDDEHDDENIQSPTSCRPHDHQRQTRCLVFSELIDSKDDFCSVGATTLLSGTMLVHVCVVSSEDLLVVAHYINTILRAACQVLDYSFPGLSWSVEGTPQSSGLQTTPTNDDVFIDIPSVGALDAMFSDPSVPQSEQYFSDADTEAAAMLLLTELSK